MSSWEEIVASEEFQAIPEGERGPLRDAYFEKNIAPALSPEDDVGLVREAFDEKTKHTDLTFRQKKYEDDTGFFERLGMRLKGGVHDVMASAGGSSVVEDTEELSQLEEKEKMFSDFDSGIPFPEDSFANQMQQENPERFDQWMSDVRAEIPKKRKFIESTRKELLQSKRRHEKEGAAVPRAPVSEAVLQAKNFDEAWEIAKIAPISFIGEVGARSLPMMAIPILKGIAGGLVMGPVGFAAGMGSGSFTVERAASLNEAMVSKLHEQGVDINNEEAIFDAISQPEFFDQMKQDANARGLIIGYFDALSGGLASKTMAPAVIKKAMAKELFNVTAQMPVQGALGGLGEASAQYVTEGEIRAGEIMGEIAGEFIQAPGEVLSATLAGVRGQTVDKVKADIDKDENLKQRKADLDAKADEYREAKESGATEIELEAREEEIMEDSTKFMEEAQAAHVKYEEEERMIKGLEQDLGFAAMDETRTTEAIQRDRIEVGIDKPAMEPPKKVASVAEAVAKASAVETKKTEAITRKTETQMQKALREAASGIDQAATEVDTQPTEAQKESGNYKKGHVSVQGLPVAIENPKGSERSGTDEGGQKWTQKMGSHYGYIKKSEGADGDQVDVFLGKGAEAATSVFVVNQNNPYTGKFDEHKVIIGPTDSKAAEKEYLSNYAKDWAGLESTVEMSMPEFKAWLKGDTTKPAQQADVAKLTPKTAMAMPTEEQKLSEPKFKKSEKKKSSRAPRRELKGQARYRNSAGDLAGAPPGVKSPQKRTSLVAKMVKVMEDDLAQAPDTFEWYDNSGKAILAAANGDKKVAENIVRLFAFYSQANSLGGNTTAAIKSLYEIARGNMEPRAGRFPNRTKKYIKGLLEAKEFTTAIPGVEDKLMNFYRNLHDSTFDTNLFDEAATQDRWMLRLFGYTEKGDGVSAGKAQYDFAHDLNVDITKAYNKKHGTELLPREAQAALWFYARNIAGKEKAEAAGKEFKAPAAVDFAHYLNRATEVVTWEAVPSVGSGILPGIHFAADEQVAEYNEAVYDILTDAEGNDIILKKLGAVLSRTDHGMGSFELSINPNMITKIVADKEEGVYDREIVDLYSNMIGIIMTQDAVPWHRADPTLSGPTAAVGLEVSAPVPFTREMAEQFYAEVSEIQQGVEFSLIDGRLRFINFRDVSDEIKEISKIKRKDRTVEQKAVYSAWEKNQKALDKKFKETLSTVVDQFDKFDILEKIGQFKAEGEYYDNSWTENEKGQEFENRISEAGRSDLLDWVRGRRQAVQRVNEKFAGKYGWNTAPERQTASPVPLSRLEDPAAAQLDIYSRFGTLNRDTDSTEDLKIYNLDDLIENPGKVDTMLADYGYSMKYFSFHEDPAAGVKFTVPKLKKEHYGTGVIWIYDPRVAHGSFKDEQYTRQWRTVHELGHAITADIIQGRYGDSRREGRMGRPWAATRGHPSKRQVTVELEPLTLLEAQRAVEWEDVSFRVQRMLMEDLGITVDPNDFGREYNTNIGDAVHRVLTGDFGDPGEYGYVPRETLPSIKSILTMLERTEKGMAKEQGREATEGLDLSQYERITQDELRSEMVRKQRRPMLRRGGQGSATVADLNSHVSQLTNQWKNAPPIAVVEDYMHLPEALRDFVIQSNAQEEVDGLYDPITGHVYLVAAGIDSADHATKVIFHEVLGHAGLRATMGNDIMPFLRGVFKSNREEMNKVALEYELDLNNAADRLVAAEEWLAMKAETSPANSYVKQLISWIRQWMRKVFSGIKVTDSEVLGALGRMRSTMIDGSAQWQVAKAIHPLLSRFQKPFYSHMESVLTDKLPGKGTGQAYAATINAFVKKGVIKSEEVEWSGVLDWLAEQDAKISKADVLDYVKANKIEVQEVVKSEVDNAKKLREMFDVEYSNADGGYVITGDAAGTLRHNLFDTEEDAWTDLEEEYDVQNLSDTEYHDYQLPGGENYREVLLKLPESEMSFEDVDQSRALNAIANGKTVRVIYKNKEIMLADNMTKLNELENAGDVETYEIIHEDDRDDYIASHFNEGNILVHIRTNERTDIDGSKVLFLEEVQSDWHQAGRKKGYVKDRGERLDILSDMHNILGQPDVFEKGGVPNAPFKTTWPLLAMKRMIRYAAENGFDKIAWTTGEQQADRYDLSRQISKISLYSKEYAADKGWDAKLTLAADDISGNGVISEPLDNIDDAEAFVGKEITKKLKDQMAAGMGDSIHLTGESLKVGGEGMKGFYDQILPKTVNKYVKKWGSKTSTTSIMTANLSNKGTPLRQAIIDFYENGKTKQEARDGILSAYPSMENDSLDSVLDDIYPSPVHSVDVTDKMREAAMNGQPLFSRGAGRNQENSPEASDKSEADIVEANDKTYKERVMDVIHKLDNKIDGFGDLIDLESYRESRGKLQALIQQGQDSARLLYETFNKLSEVESLNVFEYLTDRDVEPSIIEDETIRMNAIKAKNIINSMGQMMVERGIIPAASHQNYESRYLPRVYLSYLLGDKAIKALGTGKKLSKQGYAKKRNEGLTKEYREVILGEIKDPAFLLSRAIGIPSRDLAIMEFFDKILQNPNWVLQDQLVQIQIPGTDTMREVTPYWLQNEAKRLRAMSSQLSDSPQKNKMDSLAAQYEKLAAEVQQDEQFDADEYERIPDTPQYGILRGLIVKRAIYDDIAGSGASLQDNPDAWMKMFGQGGTGTKITQMWKVMKVSLNPPSQVRNLVSNWVLLNLSGVPLHKMIPLLIRALGEIRKDGKYYKIAQEYGITAGTFSANELAAIEREFVDLQARNKGKGAMSIPGMLRIAGAIIEKAGDIYQHAEVLSKVAKIIHEVESNGNTPALAAQEANRWLFDYSAVNKFIRTARNAPIGIPFLTFYMKVLPRMMEVAATAPWRFAPYYLMLKGLGLIAAAVNDVDDDDIEALKEAMPSWLIERGHAVILPMKDEQGRWMATNMGYFFPWTAWTDLAQDFGEIGAGMVTGKPVEARNVLQGAGVFGSPLSNLITASMTNIDPFTRKEIVRDGDLPYQQMLSRLNYTYTLMAPPWMTSGGPLAKIARAGSGYKDRWGNPQPTLAQSMARVVGVNIYPIQPERSRAVNMKFMKRDLQDIKSRMKYELKDPNLSAEARRDVSKNFREQIKWKMKQIRDYAKRSAVHPNLR